ncbi:ABC transporter ATP-binding protein [Rhodococcus globerulus]|nr:ABC transporter ATP-binding protein [Rhodococcus globerulus]QXW01352.1 ABC transporter ATP-binding protein [Rhodococcus globerulus]
MTTISYSSNVGSIAQHREVAISLHAVSREFVTSRRSTTAALTDVSLDVDAGQFLAIVGPSGCGKSTILRMIAGLDEPSSGTVTIGGDTPAALARQHRLGVAFQDHALLPWSSVRRNIELPYRISGQRIDSARVDHLIDLVGLNRFGDARPKQLSGGMRQRVSIARSLVLQPDVLLLDEPFGALDVPTRRRLNVELASILETEKTTTVLVTHDIDEAVFLADHVIVMGTRPGRVVHKEHSEFERPRTRELTDTSEFITKVGRLTRQLEEGVFD